MTINTILAMGDPLKPHDGDLFLQTAHIPVGKMPNGIGWRIINGNNHTNQWIRAVTRWEHEAET